MATGSIYQASQGGGNLFSNNRRPRAVGDTFKVEIAEKLTASRKLNTETSRENSVASKGPGSKSTGGLLKKLLNLDASASGSDKFKGAGQADNDTSFNGQLAVSVVNVLPNGHLVVAGERLVALNGGNSILRFAGIVNPVDVQVGNIVSSADVVNARIELAGEGDVAESSSKTWLQRVLTDKMLVW